MPSPHLIKCIALGLAWNVGEKEEYVCVYVYMYNPLGSKPYSPSADKDSLGQ